VPPTLRHRRYVVVSRYPRAMVAFEQPTTLDQALLGAESLAASSRPDRRIGVYELRLVRENNARST